MVLVVKNPPANLEGIRNTGSIPGSGRCPGGVETHSSFLAWGIPWTVEPGSYSPQDHKESHMTETISRPYMPVVKQHGMAKKTFLIKKIQRYFLFREEVYMFKKKAIFNGLKDSIS